jgi:thymidylate kinase
MLNQSNPPIILLEGTDCVGKTTIIRQLQNLIPSHNLTKLSGAPGQKDNLYMRQVYTAATMLFQASHRNTWLIDRYTPSERVYGGRYRGLTAEQSTHLDWAEEEFSRRNGHIFLVVLDEAELAHRLANKSKEFPNEKHGDVATLLDIQRDYYECVAMDVRIENKWLVHGEYPLDVICENILAATGMLYAPVEREMFDLHSQPPFDRVPVNNDVVEKLVPPTL